MPTTQTTNITRERLSNNPETYINKGCTIRDVNSNNPFAMTTTITGIELSKPVIYKASGNKLKEYHLNNAPIILTLSTSCFDTRTNHERIQPNHIVLIDDKFFFACKKDNYLVISSDSFEINVTAIPSE